MSEVKFYIGTSGYSYGHWKNGVFYPPGLKDNQMLEFYAQHFNTVELNVTFYRMVGEGVFKSWYKRTPKDFKFVVKGTRIITHLKKLKDYEDTLNLFMNLVSNLKEKLSLILWQFPPSFRYDEGKLLPFMKRLKKGLASKYLHAFEFRHRSCFNEELYELLRRFNYCLCIADSPRWPLEEVITADFLYLRFHGGRILYGSEYSEEELKQWAKKVRKWLKEHEIKLVFAYFNNDAYGFAVKNAFTFRNLLVK